MCNKPPVNVDCHEKLRIIIIDRYLEISKIIEVPAYLLIKFFYFSLSQCKQFAMEVYDTDWHCLPIKDQKNVLILLQMAQRPFHMTYVIGNLDLYTFVEVTIFKQFLFSNYRILFILTL
jgi:hypothetical protein